MDQAGKVLLDSKIIFKKCTQFSLTERNIKVRTNVDFQAYYVLFIGV